MEMVGATALQADSTRVAVRSRAAWTRRDREEQGPRLRLLLSGTGAAVEAIALSMMQERERAGNGLAANKRGKRGTERGRRGQRPPKAAAKK